LCLTVSANVGRLKHRYSAFCLWGSDGLENNSFSFIKTDFLVSAFINEKPEKRNSMLVYFQLLVEIKAGFVAFHS